MSAQSYVSCLVHRAIVSRERTVCVDDHERNPARRRHVCHDCITALSLARNQESRTMRIATWRVKVKSAASGGANGAPRAQDRS